MASIEKRQKKNGKEYYRVVVSLGYSEDGKKLFKRTNYTPKAKTPAAAKKEAQRYAARFEEEVRNGEACTDGEHVRFNELVAFWDEQYLSVRVQTEDMTPKCREDYLRALRIYATPAIGHFNLSEIKSVHIDKIVKGMIDKGRSPKTIRSTFNVINNIFDYAYRKQIIRENPCSRCNPLPKIRKSGELHCFDEDQVKRFLNDALIMEHEYTIGSHKRKYSAYNGTGEVFTVKPYTEKRSVSLMFRTFFTLAVYSGCRRSELCALTWNDVNIEQRYLSVTTGVTSSKEYGEQIKDPKTAAGIREMKLPEICFTLLKDLKIEQQKNCLRLGSAWEGKRGKHFNDNFIFTQATGKRMNLQTPTKKFRKILLAYNETVPEELQLPLIRLHDLRHTNASHLVASGVDIETVAKRLGHSKPSFTLDIYGHALPENDEKASDKLEALFSKAE